jgi:hypothetical protein
MERGRSMEGGRGMESVGSVQLEIGSGSRGRTATIAYNRALWPQAYYPGSVQYYSYGIRFVDSVKGEEEGDREHSVHVPVHLIFILHLLLAFSVGQGFPCAILAQLLESLV